MRVLRNARQQHCRTEHILVVEVEHCQLIWENGNHMWSAMASRSMQMSTTQLLKQAIYIMLAVVADLEAMDATSTLPTYFPDEHCLSIQIRFLGMII